MFGRRPEGKRVKHLDPIVQITPYLMPWRCDAQVFLAYDAEYEPLIRYMSQKSREGVKITFMELIIAAFVHLDRSEIATHQPQLVFVDENNRQKELRHHIPVQKP